MQPTSAPNISFDEIREGDSHAHEYKISDSIYRGFLDLFGDYNPLHVNEEYALSRGMKDCVMHGGILSGFLSHFVGMVFPGRNAMLLSVDIRFLKPCYLGDCVRISTTVKQKIVSQRSLIVRFEITNNASSECISKGLCSVFVHAASE